MEPGRYIASGKRVLDTEDYMRVVCRCVCASDAELIKEALNHFKPNASNDASAVSR